MHDLSLLFDKTGIAVGLPNTLETLEQRIEMLTEKVAFFWMMMAVTAKYVVRKDVPQVQIFLETLQRLMAEIQRLIAGNRWGYRRGSMAALCVNREQQTKALLSFSDIIRDLTPQLMELGVQMPINASATLDILLSLH